MDPEIADRPSDSVSPESEAGSAIQARLAASIAARLGEPEWAEATLFWASIGPVTLTHLETLDATGQAREHDAAGEFDALADGLRAAMASPETGAWLSMTLQLTADGSFTSRFNFDRRVFDNPQNPFTAGPLGDVPDDEAYLADLARFPRAERYVPAWLPAAATSASPTGFVVPAPYDVLLGAWGWPGVLESVELQSSRALEQQDPADTLPRDVADGVGRHALAAVVADVLEPHRVATLLGLHAEAVRFRLLPAVDGAEALDPDRTLLQARDDSSPALLAVEAGVYGIIGDLVRARLAA